MYLRPTARRCSSRSIPQLMHGCRDGNFAQRRVSDVTMVNYCHPLALLPADQSGLRSKWQTPFALYCLLLRRNDLIPRIAETLTREAAKSAVAGEPELASDVPFAPISMPLKFAYTHGRERHLCNLTSKVTAQRDVGEARPWMSGSPKCYAQPQRRRLDVRRPKRS